MALIVEYGTGKSDANSYVTLLEADTYLLTDLVKVGAWRNSSSTPQKEAAIRIATRFIDGLFIHRLMGRRSIANQALAFPRVGLIADGVSILSTAVPREWKEATIELANIHRESGLPNIKKASDRGVKVKTLKADTVLKMVEYMGGSTDDDRYVYIEHLVSSFLRPSGSVIRG